MLGHAQVQANKGQQKELKQQLQKWSSIEVSLLGRNPGYNG